ncbi:hypothetical protein [Klebsiella sp. FDAARGOS_511]|uniref:hypothetical protein n=1 Tax=Klebsiella sp. FDAARGOS_511 TaxID=2488567 RepID=UPI000F5126A0|nr:hypothetical protein [Klebsiella sp. FDAARGOS_511]AYZ19557.1 hypothetical protein EGY08_24140 [Klebsiella sp. FDAARGOS_511]
MTTDITELAQRMSIERIKQIALGSTPTMGERESLAITALHFAEELKIATDAFQAAGLAQLAAEEALEKAQRANAAQDDHINQQQDRIDILERRNAELGGELSRYSMSPGQADQRMCESRAARDALGFGKDADDVAPINLRERIDGMKARIAELESQLKAAENNEIDARCHISELESRAVKLVDCDFGAVQNMSGGSTDYCHGFVDGTQNAIRAISAAGIKVEAE